MSSSTEHFSDISQLTAWLNHYLLMDKAQNNSNDSADIKRYSNEKSTNQYNYLLPLGQLRVLKIKAALAPSDTKTKIASTRLAAVKFALRWKKKLLKQDKNEQIASVYILVLDIRASGNSENLRNEDSADNPIAHSFGAQYAIEQLAIDADESDAVLQAFSWQDWQKIIATLQTPNELWRLLQYHNQVLRHPLASGKLSFDSEQALLMQFMNSPALYSQALSIDNALIKYGVQDEPNRSLVAMSLAQKHSEAESKNYHEQLHQAAILWTQLSEQMLLESQSADHLGLWQQQLLAESLFSRYELIHTLYNHPRQPAEKQQTGYVVHQHSYESLGRHYVFIFYGQQQQSRQAIAPNLETIAKDVATRLPIAELHHIVVLGIEFIVEAADSYIDIDLFIQPVTAMSAKERQLTKQLQRLSAQQEMTQKIDEVERKGGLNTKTEELPKIQLSLHIPANKKK